jgi:hypothetical protein
VFDCFARWRSLVFDCFARWRSLVFDCFARWRSLGFDCFARWRSLGAGSPRSTKYGGEASQHRYERQASLQPWRNSDGGCQRVPQRHLYHHALRCELLRPDRDRTISGDETRNAVRGGHCDFSPRLHGTSSGDGELLLDLSGATVRRVVALHHEHLGTPGDRPVDRLIVGQLETDRVADLDRPPGGRYVKNPWTGTSYRLRTHLLQQRD